MTPQQIRLVQSTWLALLPNKEAGAALFYNRLFELDPSLRQLFRGDMHAQGQKLMQVIDAAVNGLSRFEQMIPVIEALGRRHAGYGVQDRHYGTVGSALLWTLEQALKDAFTQEVKEAWTAVYATLATAMREAGRAATSQGGTSEPQPAGARAGNPVASVHVASSAGGRPRVLPLVVTLGLAAAIGLGINLAVSGLHSTAAPRAAATAEPGRFLLNAMLVPALEPETLPLRWVDPRRAMRCGPDSTVKVEGAPLMPGALVPDAPFELEWHAQDCRPFGRYGPRFDGHVKFTVYREDWGFSAAVEPTNLRVVSRSNEAVLIQAGTAILPAYPLGPDAAPDVAQGFAQTNGHCGREQRPCS